MIRLRTLIKLIFLVAFVWGAGLMIFVSQIEALNEPTLSPDMEKTDGIVVLTGGSERVPAGIALLRAGKGDKLFISGVPHNLTLDSVLGNQPISKELRDCCIVLGHEAESTLGNADETRTWMALEETHSMRLVTANYHMPRSMLLFHDAMPDIKIIPHPVTPDNVKLEDWWERPGTASLLITEYNKYLWVILRLWMGMHV